MTSFTFTRHELTYLSRLKCSSCQKLLLRERFSNRKLNDIKFLIFNGREVTTNGTGITCTFCTPGSREELECSTCHVVRPLESFSKAQRRERDFPVRLFHPVTYLFDTSIQIDVYPNVIGAPQRCEFCISWTTAQEAGLDPEDAPGTERQADKPTDFAYVNGLLV